MFLTMRYPHQSSNRSRGDSESINNSGNGNGRLKTLLNRPKHVEVIEDRPRSEGPPPTSSTTTSTTPTQHLPPAVITTPQPIKSVSSFDVTGGRRRGEAIKTPTEFEENPQIPSSPGGTPPKKMWEGAYSKFLKGTKDKSSSPTMSSLSSTASMCRDTVMSNERMDGVTSQSPPSDVVAASEGVKKSFSLIPGSKRLVSRATYTTPPRSPGKHINSRITQVDDSSAPPFPSLRISPRVSSNNSRKQFTHASKNSYPEETAHVNTAASVGSAEGSSVRGGKLFKSVFSRSSNDVFGRSERSHRSHKSMDALDVPMRNGIQKTNSSGPPGYLDGKTHPEPLRPASALVDQLDRSPCTTPLNETASKEPDSGSLDDLLASAASTPSNRHLMMPPTGVQRAYSTGMVHPMMVEDSTLQPSMQSVSALSRLQRAQTCGDGAYQQQQFHYNIHHLHQSENNYPNLQMPQIPPLIPQHPLTGQYHTVSSSDHSQNVGLMLDDSENSHSETNCFQEQPGKIQNGNYSGDAPKGGLEQMLADPNFVIPSAGYSPSSPANIFQPTPDIKKAFTNFHNASKFARDATSAFLGGESSSNIDLAGTHESYVSYHAALMRAGRRSSVGSGDVVSDRALPHRLPPLETVDEQNISIHKGMRLLKPVQGTESWQQGRRYLIGPAALATCSLSVINRLSGTLTMSATEAATSDLTQGFGTIDLGGALMTYIGEKHHLSLGKWSSCRLVLKQNYLYEFDVDTPINGLPRGFVHLQYAVAYPHADFHDSLELQFFASPCAKADHRTLMIQVQNREERDHWVTCLNKAAKLRLEDLWEFDSSRVLGVGRYASVVPAKRKAVLSHGTAGCALKIVDKNQFWRRVVKGRERADTLVRELAVQSTLTIKCGRVPTFVQLRGFFETSDNVVIELELLEGKDLFDYVKSKGVLGEEEAGVIIRDVLTSLDCMNRIGLAHRDVKPANILMTDIFKDGTSVKLGDFGMSTFVGVDGLVRGRCGTPGYVAPEILTAGTRAGYGNSVDVFSAGVSLYVMLAGYEPFYGETEKDLVEANKLAEIAYAESDWSRISPLARDLVERMLQKDPSQRITAKEALQHPWLATFAQKKSHGRIWKDTHGLKNLGLAVDETPEGGVCTLM